MTTLAQRLKQARQLREFTQSELSKKSNLSQQLISRIESGKVESTTEIFKLSDALDVIPKWLATGEGDMEYIKMTSANISEDEIRFIQLVRNLTTGQREQIIKGVEETTIQNEKILKELS